MIHVLSPHIVNKIAAGEVIERPASVVKELVENAIDAGAQRIRIDIEEGGTRLIKVSDDGRGIVWDDMDKVFISHATSKLRQVEDLEEIASLGFRGEALASIGAVSRATVRSRPSDRDAGAVIEDFGGQVSQTKEVGMAPGTVVEVRDLFFNTPARLKFMKTPQTEMVHIVDMVTRLALSHADIGFQVSHGTRRLFATEEGETTEQRIGTALGRDFASNLIRFEREESWGRVEAYLGNPESAKRRTKFQLAFVNGRAVKDRTILAAVRRGYTEFVPDNLQPPYVLFLSMPPRDVDVNVHPTKIEVRFRDASRIFSSITGAVGQALTKSDLAPRPKLQARQDVDALAAPKPAVRDRVRESPSLFEAASSRPQHETLGDPNTSRSTEPVADHHEARDPSMTTEASTRIVGPAATGNILQAHKMFLIYEVPEGLMIVDQHALHERIVYEQLKRQFTEGKIIRQNLLIPHVVEVSAQQIVAIEEIQEQLDEMGVELRPFGEQSVALYAFPAVLDRCDPARLVSEILASLDGGKVQDRHDLLDRTLYTMACHRSVRGGDRLSYDEMRALLEQAESTELSQTCPHGRPTRVVLGKDELEKLFKRRGF